MDKEGLLKKLKEYKSDRVFNPYSGVCDVYDTIEAPAIRRQNLSRVLDSLISHQIDSIWVGRDLGYRGGRRTGLAFTDESNLEMASMVWKADLRKATKGGVVSERTATNIWNFINKIDEKIFMWNVFPFHPHEKYKPHSNRSHTSEERNIGMEFLKVLVNLLQPRKIVAIGNDAYDCSCKVFSNTKIVKIRHPSYGGEKMFSKEISELYGLENLKHFASTSK